VTNEEDGLCCRTLEEREELESEEEEELEVSGEHASRLLEMRGRREGESSVASQSSFVVLLISVLGRVVFPWRWQGVRRRVPFAFWPSDSERIKPNRVHKYPLGSPDLFFLCCGNCGGKKKKLDRQG
jgi:hypothetical protein